MSAKIIDSHRYKTITRTQLDKKRKNVENSYKVKNRPHKKVKISNDSAYSIITNLRIKKHRERKIEREMLLYSRPQRTVIKEPKQKVYIPKWFGIFCGVVVVILVLVISINVIRKDEDITAVFNNSDDTSSSNVKLANNYDLKVGLTDLENTNVLESSNLILNDLYNSASYSLVKINEDYSLKYEVAKGIEKISNNEYDITLNDKYKLNSDDVRYSVNKILSAGESNMYYDEIASISSIEDIDSKYKIKVKLKQDNPYFVYSLDFPVLDDENKILQKYSNTASDSSILFTKTTNDDEPLNSIKIQNYNSVSECVNAFVNGNIDVFFASSNNDMQLIGKNDYNMKKYRDGETLFILGNKNSNIFSRKEVRSALMQSLNRDEIVKSSDNTFIEVIDLPFLYSGIKYKYDLVGADNLMSSNGWTKNNSGYYYKVENGSYVNATLKLLVSSDDSSKVNIANNIKNMAALAGIDVEIEEIPSREISSRINSSSYDIVLASVYLNEIPNISFLKDYVNINTATNTAFEQVENSSIEDLPNEITNLEYVLSDEVACIGIYARNINLVYKKDIYGFNNINYMRIFTDLDSIGKIEGE